MNNLPCSSAPYWVDQWNEARLNSPPVRRALEAKNGQIDKLREDAPVFIKPGSREIERQHRQEVLEWLEAAGALGATRRVLDMEAGTGTYTMPFAERGALVTALEPCRERALSLRQRVLEQELHAVSIITKSWPEISLRQEGLAGKFDLVFCLSNTMVQDPSSIEKLMQASRKYCFLSASSGPIWTQPQIELWELFFQETLQGNPGDILYPFGLLYAMGYRPEMRFNQQAWTYEEPVEMAVEDLCSFFQAFITITSEIKGIIEDYVRIRSPYGIFVHQVKTCQGMMLWRVDQRIE